MPEIKREKTTSNEFLIVLYFCMFSFLKPLTVVLGSLSTVVLFGAAVLVFSLSLILNRCRFNLNSLWHFLITMVILVCCFACDYLFRKNALLFDNLYSFIINGVIPMFLIINVKDYKKVLWWWCTLTMAVGLIFIGDPFNGYILSGGYMPFGFNHMLPAFISCVVFLLYYRKKWAIAPAILFFVEIVMYANKGSLVTAGAFCLLFVLFMRKLNNKKIFRIVALLTVLVIILFALRFVIFDAFYNLALAMGIDSYSLATFREMLYFSPDRIFALRTDIWDLCLTELEQGGWFSGMGIGMFQTKYSRYPHNVFFDIAVTFGVFAVLIFAILLIKSIFDFKKFDRDKKTFMLVIFTLWFFPMQISLSFWNYIPFWIYWGVYLQGISTGLKKRVPAINDQAEEV